MLLFFESSLLFVIFCVNTYCHYFTLLIAFQIRFVIFFLETIELLLNMSVWLTCSSYIVGLGSDQD